MISVRRPPPLSDAGMTLTSRPRGLGSGPSGSMPSSGCMPAMTSCGHFQTVATSQGEARQAVKSEIDQSYHLRVKIFAKETSIVSYGNDASYLATNLLKSRRKRLRWPSGVPPVRVAFNVDK